jgi:DNA-directed RNA polymerase specialized sigma24 family protein
VESVPEITELLAAWTGGNRAALDALMPSVIDELKRIASSYLANEPHARTLQTTALIHEAYLRLAQVRPRAWENRGQFYALTAQIMRRILVDHARSQVALQRGGVRCEGIRVEAVLLAANRERMRVAIPSERDITEWNRVDACWLTETGEQVEIESLIPIEGVDVSQFCTAVYPWTMTAGQAPASD